MQRAAYQSFWADSAALELKRDFFFPCATAPGKGKFSETGWADSWWAFRKRKQYGASGGGETNVTDDPFRKLITSNQRSQIVLVKGYAEVPTAQREKQKYLTNDTSAEIINTFRNVNNQDTD